MKLYYLSFLFLLSFFIACKAKLEEKNSPNIVVFLVDGMGWQDTSLPFWDKKTPFNERYHTPNMERLAKEGMKFTQAYATPVCTPTPVSLMTGMNAARHRVTNWTSQKDKIHGMEKNHPTLEIPEWNMNGLSPVTGNHTVYTTTLPQLIHLIIIT